MDSKQTQQHRQHFNLSESAKQMLEELTAQRYPGKQRRQSQLVEDLITEAFAKERSMGTATFNRENSEPDPLAPETQEALNLAQQEAVTMGANQVYPEHLLLGVIAQGQSKAARLLCFSGMDMPAIRVRAAEVFGAHYNDANNADLTFSAESHQCVARAVGLVEAAHAFPVLPEHLVLAVLHHEQMQVFLTPWIASLNRVIEQLAEGTPDVFVRGQEEPAQETARGMMKWFYARRKPDQLVPITFANIPDHQDVKQQLQAVVDRLKNASGTRDVSGEAMKVVLVGPPSRERTTLIGATAGEAKVPLFYIAGATLLEMVSGLRQRGDFGLPAEEYAAFRSGGEQGYIHYVFTEAKRLAPALLWLDDLAAITRLAVNERRKQIFEQFLKEIDGIDARSGVVLILTTNQPSEFDNKAYVLKRFNLRIFMEPSQPQIAPATLAKSLLRQQVAETMGSYTAASSPLLVRLCPSCKREMQPGWKHCVYCGAALALVCAKCGTPRLEVEGARFCFECGNAFE
ncbi:MAG TPA: AAA family ATPase [Ktedonosporobacter sp.]|nr:AAA family ATPase [Ktedonosporobacter sp.]